MAKLILIGLRGSGKSTIGRLTAARLGCGFIDLDDLTPKELDCSTVAEAWVRGEPAFRAAEVAALTKALATPPGVLALGGGTPTAPGAADILQRQRDSGTIIVYLHAPPNVLRERLGASDNSHRPALTPGAANAAAEVDLIYARRDPLYRSLASIIIETSDKTEGAVVDAVVAAVKHSSNR